MFGRLPMIATLHELNTLLQQQTLRRRDGILVRAWHALFGAQVARERPAPETRLPPAESLIQRKPESEPGE